MPPKQLELLRHAKSSWAEAELADHDRPLNSRGRDAAALIGRHLHQQDLLPDLVLCSSAVRARQTSDRLGLPAAIEVKIEDDLYGASALGLLARIHQVPASVQTLLVIGHNPGIEDLARMLGRQGPQSIARFPTAALAVFGLPIDAWTQLGPGSGHLDGFVTPRELSPEPT
jgi:phosphohistidine phosphatase